MGSVFIICLLWFLVVLYVGVIAKLAFAYYRLKNPRPGADPPNSVDTFFTAVSVGIVMGMLIYVGVGSGGSAAAVVRWIEALSAVVSLVMAVIVLSRRSPWFVLWIIVTLAFVYIRLVLRLP